MLWARVTNPFFANCPSSGRIYGGDGDVGYGFAAHGRLWLSERSDFSGHFTAIEPGDDVCTLIPRSYPKGTHRLHAYAESLGGDDAIHVIDFRAGFSPSWLPWLRLSSGVGWEMTNGVPVLMGGTASRWGRRPEL